MTLRRRQFLHLAAGAVACSPFSESALAQTYPSRPVKIIVGQAAGSASRGSLHCRRGDRIERPEGEGLK